MIHARTRSVCCGLLFGVIWGKVKACVEESLIFILFRVVQFLGSHENHVKITGKSIYIL